MNKKILNVSSDNQHGGITGGIIHNDQKTINTYIWKGRKEGFLVGVGIAVAAELIIQLLSYGWKYIQYIK